MVPDFNKGKEGQRGATMRQIMRHGVFRGWLSEDGAEAELHKIALLDCIDVYGHSLAKSSSSDYCCNYFHRYSQL